MLNNCSYPEIVYILSTTNPVSLTIICFTVMVIAIAIVRRVFMLFGVYDQDDLVMKNRACSLESVPVKLLSRYARLPERANATDAGADVFSAKNLIVEPHGKAIVPLEISLAVPVGYYMRVAPRSGLAAKKFIDVGAGVIDSDYRGPVGVVLFNFSDTHFEIERGDKIAQLILEKIDCPKFNVVDTLPDTVRGSGGFGSTGIN